MQNAELIKILKEKIDILYNLKELIPPKGFGNGQFQTSVPTWENSPKPKNKINVDEICDNLSGHCKYLDHKALIQILKLVLKEDSINLYSNINNDSIIDLTDIDDMKLEQSLRTLRLIIPPHVI